jgi:hypothetical protein
LISTYRPIQWRSFIIIICIYFHAIALLSRFGESELYGDTSEDNQNQEDNQDETEEVSHGANMTRPASHPPLPPPPSGQQVKNME